MEENLNNRLSHGSKIGKIQKSYQGWEISDKNNISTVAEKRIAFIVKRTKICLYMTQWQKELEEGQLKLGNMRT